MVGQIYISDAYERSLLQEISNFEFRISTRPPGTRDACPTTPARRGTETETGTGTATGTVTGWNVKPVDKCWIVDHQWRVEVL
jgi:hypothetical protein